MGKIFLSLEMLTQVQCSKLMKKEAAYVPQKYV